MTLKELFRRGLCKTLINAGNVLVVNKDFTILEEPVQKHKSDCMNVDGEGKAVFTTEELQLPVHHIDNSRTWDPIERSAEERAVKDLIVKCEEFGKAGATVADCVDKLVASRYYGPFVVLTPEEGKVYHDYRNKESPITQTVYVPDLDRVVVLQLTEDVVRLVGCDPFEHGPKKCVVAALQVRKDFYGNAGLAYVMARTL